MRLVAVDIMWAHLVCKLLQIKTGNDLEAPCYAELYHVLPQRSINALGFYIAT